VAIEEEVEEVYNQMNIQKEGEEGEVE